MTPKRVYGGKSGDERLSQRRARLLEAGLTLLAADDSQAFGVRGVSREAGLASRYFYESFADASELAAAVFDAAIIDLTTSTLIALDEADDEPVLSMARVGVGALVRHIAEDPRRGRLLFSPGLAALPVIAERRRVSTRVFVELLGTQAQAHLPLGTGPRFDVATEVLVGGLAQAVSAWLDGHVAADLDTLVDVCAALFVSAAEKVSAS